MVKYEMGRGNERTEADKMRPLLRPQAPAPGTVKRGPRWGAGCDLSRRGRRRRRRRRSQKVLGRCRATRPGAGARRTRGGWGGASPVGPGGVLGEGFGLRPWGDGKPGRVFSRAVTRSPSLAVGGKDGSAIWPLVLGSAFRDSEAARVVVVKAGLTAASPVREVRFLVP